MRLFKYALATSLLIAAPAAIANSKGNHFMPGTHLSFYQTKTISSHPDLLTLDFSISSRATTPAAAQENLNQRVAKAISTLKAKAGAIPGISIQAQNYSVYRDYQEKNSTHWVASQSLEISAPLAEHSKTSVHLLSAAGTLQNQDVLLQNISWGLQEPTRNSLTKQATEEALKELRQTAQADAKALELNFKKFATINVEDGGSHGPRPLMMRAMANASPQATPSDISVSVSVKATAVLEK